jgi:hypothetical protein
MAKITKMTAEQRAQYQANVDHLRALLVKNGFTPPRPASQPKR